MSITQAALDANAVHVRFNAFVQTNTDIEQFAVIGNRSFDRPLPQALLDYKKENRYAGFTFVLRIRDRCKAIAYVAATQDGHFWPLPAGREDGMGALARNEWAAKSLSERFTSFGVVK